MRIALALLLGSVSLSGLHAGEWPGFLGGGKTVVEAKTLPDRWSPRENVVWKTDISGLGWSCPIVAGDAVYLTTVVSDGKVREPQKGLYINDLQGTVPPGEHRWLVLKIDFKTGKILWAREVHKGIPAQTRHLKNSYASETPVTDGRHVWAYFGNVGVFCLDSSGKVVWEKRFAPVKTRFGWGTAASPVLHQGKLFIINDNEESSWLLALDSKTGKELWKVNRPEKSNWATPCIWENEKRTEIVTAGSGKIRSYDLNGKLLWELGPMSTLAIPTPFARDGLLYVTSGYVLDNTRPLYAIKPGGRGDLSLKRGQNSSEHIAWVQRQAGPYHPTPVKYGEYIYVLLDRGLLSCYEAKTGKAVYERQRLGPTAFTASPWAYDGKVFCTSEEGETIVVKAGPKFEILGRNSLDEMILSSPAIVDGSLLLRTQNRLYRLEKK